MFFSRKIQILIEIIFAVMNFKNIKNSQSGKFAEIYGKVQCGVSYFDILHRHTI
jgi:hypothetical protein